MVTRKVPNPERLKKIKGSRETLASSLTTSFTTSLSVHSERLLSFVFSLQLTLSGGVSIWMGDLKNLPLRNRSKGPKILF